MALVVKNPPNQAGDPRDASSTPGSGRSPGGQRGDPLHYSCLENPMDRGAWQATIHQIAELDRSDFTHMILPLEPLPEHPGETKISPARYHRVATASVTSFNSSKSPRGVSARQSPSGLAHRIHPTNNAQSPVHKTSELLSEHLKYFFKKKTEEKLKIFYS